MITLQDQLRSLIEEGQRFEVGVVTLPDGRHYEVAFRDWIIEVLRVMVEILKERP